MSGSRGQSCQLRTVRTEVSKERWQLYGSLSWDPWMDPHVGLTQTFVFTNMFQIHGTPKEEEISKISWKVCPVTGQSWCSSISCAAIITRIDLTSLLQDSLPRDDNSTWHLPATWTNDQWQKLDDMDIFCQKYPSPRVYISQDQMWNVYILSKKNSLSFNPSGICWKKFDDDIQGEAEALAITGKNSHNGHH